MDIDVFPIHQLDTVFRVLRTALAPDTRPDARERRFLDTYARIVGYPLGPADPLPIAAAAVNIAGARQRKRLVQLAAIAALLRRPVAAAGVTYVKALADQLAVHEDVIGVLEALQRGQALRARLLATRRTLGSLLGEARRAGGWAGVLRFLAAMFLRRGGDHALHARYERLATLPEGTLGRTYWQHMKSEGFGFPGAPGGIAESVAYHDVAHVLAGHEATPLGEIQQGSFQGGNRRTDGFFFIQFVLLQFHHGIKASPVAPAAVGHFDPELVLWAIHRGARCSVDMTHGWDFWPLMPLPLDEARERCGLLPRLRSAAA
ncbi:MAG: hypothetical protein KF788_14055 [Piscinibacter sp.]|nr:hypothetical protein [Piscinibacter sp.]